MNNNEHSYKYMLIFKVQFNHIYAGKSKDKNKRTEDRSKPYVYVLRKIIDSFILALYSDMIDNNHKFTHNLILVTVYICSAKLN